MTDVTASANHPAEAAHPATLPLLAATVFLAVAVIGFALSVVPTFVHDRLGFGPVVVGASVGIQFLATVLTRPLAGRIADERGGAVSLRISAASCAASGVVLIVLALLPGAPAWIRLAILVAGRLLLGLGESQLIVGALGWGIGLVGPARSGRVLAWVGMAMYGALGAGAPLGLVLAHAGGLALVGAATIVLPLLGLALSRSLRFVPPAGGRRPPFAAVLGAIWRHGTVVALQGVGFAAIGAFVTLDFASHAWPRAGLALSAFGIAFVALRIIAGGLPDRFGGYPVAVASLAVEACGQAVLFGAGTAWVALFGAAITGAGCSMVFPSLGVEVVRRIGPESRGTALGGFAAFQDVAYGTTSPVAGVLAAAFGLPSVFALGSLAAAAGLLATVGLRATARREAVAERG